MIKAHKLWVFGNYSQDFLLNRHEMHHWVCQLVQTTACCFSNLFLRPHSSSELFSGEIYMTQMQTFLIKKCKRKRF